MRWEATATLALLVVSIAISLVGLFTNEEQRLGFWRRLIKWRHWRWWWRWRFATRNRKLVLALLKTYHVVVRDRSLTPSDCERLTEIGLTVNHLTVAGLRNPEYYGYDILTPRLGFQPDTGYDEFLARAEELRGHLGGPRLKWACARWHRLKPE